MIQIPDINLGGILPALVLSITGLVILGVGLVFRTGKGVLAFSCISSLVGAALAFLANMPLQFVKTRTDFSGLIVLDPFTWFLNIVILIATVLTLLMFIRYLADEDTRLFEYFVLLLFCSAGMMFMVSGNHILVIFVGLETLSISVYVLAGSMPNNVKAKEAALKYLILGAFSSGIFMYGAALLFGAVGSLGLPAIVAYFKGSGASLLGIVGMGMLLIGFSFKVAAVPFHMWTPDVYEGAPTPLTAYMSVGVKAAAFAALIRVFIEVLQQPQTVWPQILWVIAALTMILGNLAALVQQNIKRMLAYSSIAHAGYILVGLVAGQAEGASAILYYLLAYTLTNMGAFAVVALVGRKGEAYLNIDDYRGMAKDHPALALAMSIFIFSLAGLPPTAGFVGKFSIFSAAIKQGYYWLVVIGVLTSAASVFYYFRVIMKMYMEQGEPGQGELQFSPGTILALVVAVVGVMYIGIFPARYLTLALESVKPLFF
jgi:NADH-quinone oxidoreductase subunit N